MRFNVRDLLESIVEPSKVISDQYAAITIAKKNGRVVTGRVGNLHGDSLSIIEDMFDPGRATDVRRADIEEIKPSDVSLMPIGLLNSLTKRKSKTSSHSSWPAATRETSRLHPERRSAVSPIPCIRMGFGLEDRIFRVSSATIHAGSRPPRASPRSCRGFRTHGSQSRACHGLHTSCPQDGRDCRLILTRREVLMLRCF